MDNCSQSQKRRRSGKIEEQEIMKNLEADDSLINKLPDDCLKYIFSFLPILERLEAEKICKRWRIIGEGGWNDIKTLRIDENYSDHTIYLIFKRCGRFLKKLKIHESREQSEDRLSMIIEFCKLDQLEDIEIRLEYRISYDECLIRNVRRIFEEARKLVAVTIERYEVLDSNDYLNVSNLETLEKLCLKTLYERWDAPSDGFTIDPDRFPNLKELELFEMNIVEDEITREEWSLKGLEKLTLNGCAITENFIQRISTFRNLQKLSLCGEDSVRSLKKEHIRSIAMYCNKLRDIAIHYSSNLTAECFGYLGEMPLLEVLEINDLEIKDRDDLIGLGNLKHLYVSIDEEPHCYDAIVKLIETSSNLEKLELVFFDWVNITFFNDLKEIYHRGMKKNHLYLNIIYNDDRIFGAMQPIPDHPLLTISYDPF